MSKSTSTKQRRSRGKAEPPRCLECSTVLDAPIRTSQTCASCGSVNLREDLRIFRTRRPWPRRIEAALKAVVAITLGAFTFQMLTSFEGTHGGYAGAGFAIGTPILMALVLWDTLGLITRRHSILRMEVFWPAFAASAFLGPLALFLVLGMGVSKLDGGTWLIGPVLLTFMIGYVSLRIWRATRPYQRQRAVPASDGAPDPATTAGQ